MALIIDLIKGPMMHNKPREIEKYATLLAFPQIGKNTVIYLALDTKKQYHYTGGAYVLLSETDISGKVDKVAGKGLSTEDYSTADKNKLGGIEAGAQVNQDISGKVDKVAGKGLSTEDYSTADKNKLGGIEAGAQVNQDI
ncbi:MAG: hypothetical protein WCR20_01250, partial [Verrucomicrobiota bacterium]